MKSMTMAIGTAIIVCGGQNTKGRGNWAWHELIELIEIEQWQPANLQQRMEVNAIEMNFNEAHAIYFHLWIV